MKKIIVFCLIIIISAGLFMTCKKDKGNAPVLPPFESMYIDFSNFTSLKKSFTIHQDGKGTESSTWQFAASIAGIWNDLITSSIAVPLAAYDSAAKYSAGYVSENLWQWSYDFTFDGVDYKSVLQGEVSTNSVSWKMYLTKNISGGYTDFLSLSGTSETDGSGGQWIFYQSPQSSVEIFQTDWTKSGDLVTGVKYTYLINDPNKDSFINYLIDTNSDLDAGYNIHFSDGTYSDSDIEWNTTTRHGRLKCLDYLQDENWYCWDNNKINKVCD
jgi:hypothetical protein